MDRYIGLDAHASSCTVAVVGPSGKQLSSQVVETNAGALVGVIRAVPKNRHLCLEEGTLSEWLVEVLTPHVQELVVAGVTRSQGAKSDKWDAFGLAEQLRTGAIKTKVYKKRGRFGALKHMAKGYAVVVEDSVRVKNRIKSMFRSRGVPTSGRGVYAVKSRDEWLARLPTAAWPQAQLLYYEHDMLMELRQRAKQALLSEARKHRACRLVRKCPGMGPVRSAELVPVVVTPHRFQSKRRFWSYCGLGIVMRSSSDWVRTRSGRWVRDETHQTRGLNPNCNRTLKRIFKGAATSVITRAEDEPLYCHYLRLLNEGTKPNLAKLTIARQIASIVLAVWRNEEEYDPKKLLQRMT